MSCNVIAIDGPAGVGKTTIAKKLSKKINAPVLFSGQLYRAVAYEMYQNSTGLESFDKLFEFAELVKDSFQYQELSLRYDEFDPKDGGKSAQLVIIMPEMPETFTANYDRKLSTYYNENLQSDEALVELV